MDLRARRKRYSEELAKLQVQALRLQGAIAALDEMIAATEADEGATDGAE